MNIKEITRKAETQNAQVVIGAKITDERYRKFRIYCRIHKTNVNRLLNQFITGCLEEMTK
ncbi:MAG: hypothetical protein LBD63_02795 [Mycoplasmataceae bacterium]|jgi:hypothetical protein|nr:hypothetical protein [Mycoplasmataceae bacterium]